jgi:hypothetical protein
MPVAAVSAGGNPSASSGSPMTSEGSIFGWKMMRLVWSVVLVRTAARPTSDPVPAVVGTASSGWMTFASARVHQSPMSSRSQTGIV